MKYGSLSDKFEYGWDGSGEGYQPAYHCGPPDGIRDRKAVNHAAIEAANQALSESCGSEMSRDFEQGFQTAFLDIANGGSGALPAVPPPRYWTAAYRTTWGHHKAREWFEGYQAGANAAKCGALREAQTVPTSVYRTCDRQVAAGFGGRADSVPVSQTTPAGWGHHGSMPTPAWNGQPASPYTPYLANPYPAASPQATLPPAYSPPTYSPPANPWPTTPVLPSPSFTQPVPSYSPPAWPTPQPPIAPPTAAPNPWNSFSTPTPGDPFSYSGGHSVAPGMMAPTVRPQPQTSLPANNPWTQFSEFGPSGFRSEGASR